jgi:hypothetical protein
MAVDMALDKVQRGNSCKAQNHMAVDMALDKVQRVYLNKAHVDMVSVVSQEY